MSHKCLHALFISLQFCTKTALQQYFIIEEYLNPAQGLFNKSTFYDYNVEQWVIKCHDTKF